ncbi:MAG: 23S rRNA (pseudouridine(1915)-N(3))-methyltransferase RlmH [Eubacteriales bacterium]|nr:23S rRNA (pseudouridine(1915)-N(3))-methyltransferase RlmH [Eubacteriales bacterium]
MRITVVCVGKIKEKYFADAIKEYAKRLSRYARLEIVEVTDEKTPDGASDGEEKKIKEKEGERILKSVKEGSYVIALAIQGKKVSSEGFADFVEKRAAYGDSHLTFIIGGSLGLDERVLKRADYLLSFSDMTFPHQLMRVILLEQIYRGFRIINHEPYHK